MVSKVVRIPVTDIPVWVIAGTEKEIIEAFVKRGIYDYSLDGKCAAVGGIEHKKKRLSWPYVWFLHGKYDTAVIVHECIHLICRIQEEITSEIVAIPPQTEELFACYFESVFSLIMTTLQPDIELSIKGEEELRAKKQKPLDSVPPAPDTVKS